MSYPTVMRIYDKVSGLFGKVTASDAAATDSALVVREAGNGYYRTQFGHTRTASPYTLLDANFKYNIDTDNEWETDTATGGTVAHQVAPATAKLSVTATNASRARLRTHRYFRYQSGKQQRIILTCTHADTGQSNQVRRWGYFDDNDGLFFELSGTTLQARVRTSTSGSPSDGSAISLSLPPGFDIRNGNIYEIGFQWLGVGNVQFWINGYLAATKLHAGLLTLPYMRTAQLPVQFEIVNTAGSTGSSFDAICVSVNSEGGSTPSGYSYSASRDTALSVGTTEIPIISIRPKAEWPAGSGLVNKAMILPQHLSISCTSKAISYRIWIGTVSNLTGASWVSAATGAVVEYDITATAFSNTNARRIHSDVVETTPGEDHFRMDHIFSDQGTHLNTSAFATVGSTNQDTLIVTAFTASATADVKAALGWRGIQ